MVNSMPAVSSKAKAGKDPFCMKEILREQGCYDGDHFTVLYNKKALTEGHTLIITKRHTLGLLDLTAGEAKELFDMIGKVLPVLLDTYNNGERAYDLKIRSGEFSGRTVNHFHLHLIPRKRVPREGGGTEYERIYEKSLQNIDRPFLDDISNDLRRLRRGLNNPDRSAATSEAGSSHSELGVNLRKNIFYESEYFFALYHPAPVIEGQVLLVPKRDISDFLELSGREREDFAYAYSKVMAMLLKRYGNGSRSYITSMQTGGYDNMPLNRLHINLIPRTKGDRYAGHDDDMYYDIYERKTGGAVMTGGEIEKEVKSLGMLAARDWYV